MDFQQQGYAIARKLFSSEEIAILKKELGDRITSPHGMRHLQAKVPHLSDRIASPAFNVLLEDYFTCCLEAGDALIMQPLLLHSSLKTKVKCDRRINHLEYAAIHLPGGLQWSEEI